MPDQYLVFCAADRLHALAIRTVLEIMRPSAIDRVEGAPAFVLGVARVRGRATPVVSAATLLTRAGDRDGARRWIHVRAEPDAGSTRTVVLGVDDVLGVFRGEELGLEACAPLLADASGEMLEQLGRLDGALVRQLRAGFRLPEFPVRGAAALEGVDPC